MGTVAPQTRFKKESREKNSRLLLVDQGLLVPTNPIPHDFFGRILVKSSLVLAVAAGLSILVFTKAAEAQCLHNTSYYVPAPTTTTFYAPAAISYYAPATTTFYDPTIAYYPNSAYYAPTTAYYGGSGYYGGGYNSGYNRGGLFGTGVGGWAGVRGVNRRWDRRGW